jgi:hypothetical protein
MNVLGVSVENPKSPRACGTRTAGMDRT